MRSPKPGETLPHMSELRDRAGPVLASRLARFVFHLQ